MKCLTTISLRHCRLHSLEALPSAVKTGAPSIQTPIRPGSSLGGIATFVQKSAPRHCTDTTNRYKKSAVNTPDFKTFFKVPSTDIKHDLGNYVRHVWIRHVLAFEQQLVPLVPLVPCAATPQCDPAPHPPWTTRGFQGPDHPPACRCHGQLPIFHPRKVITHIEKGWNTATATWKTKLFSAKQCGNCQLKNLLYSISQGVSTMIKLSFGRLRLSGWDHTDCRGDDTRPPRAERKKTQWRSKHLTIV